MTDRQIILGVFIVYLAALFVLAVWSSRETKSVAGYFIAGKKLPYWVIAFSTNATGESGWLLLGLTGMGYLVGIHALWVVVGEAVGVALAWTLIAGRLKAATDTYDSITVPDFLESRFDDRRHILRLLSVLIILSMVMAYTAAQLVATGKAFGTFLDMPYAGGVILGAVVTLAYTAVGGFKAVAYTDVLQGALMLAALIGLPIVGISAAGGWTTMTAELAATGPDLLSPLGPSGFSVAGLVAVASFLAIGLPFMGVPQLLVRFMSARDAIEIVKASVVSVVVIVLFDLGAVFTGMAGRVLFPDLADAETVMPTMSEALFPPFVTGILVVVVLAAIMSTVDSLLILASSAVVRDLAQKVFALNLSDRQLANTGKAVTLLVGVVAIFIALSQTRVIFWFVLFAWSGLGAAFGPVVACALFWRGTTLAGAVAGMAGGFITAMFWALAMKPATYDLYEMIPGAIMGLALTIGVSKLAKAKAAAPAASPARN